jgi:hypothetical protein
MINILIVSFTKKKNYYDGFLSAIQYLQHKYNIDFWKTEFDKKKRDYSKYNLILFKGNFGIDYAQRIQFNKHDYSNIKTGLIISSIDGPSKKFFEYYDILFYETNWYYNNYPILKFHPHCYHAFGVDTNIMKKYNNINKEYDIISIGTFASYKRFEFITNFKGTRIVLGNIYNNKNNPLIHYLLANNVIIKDAVSYKELSLYYNKSKLCYIPCQINGGGERAILEARACGIKVKIEGDNPKLKELCESKIYSHIDYAKSIEDGIKRLLNINDNKLPNCWFIAFKKNDNNIYNFKNFDNILYKNIQLNNNLQSQLYIADPFLYKYNKQNYLFIEYKNNKNKGVIGCINLDNNILELQTVLERDYHLSYPFIFKYQNNIYMIPESQQSNRLELYKNTQFPNKWVLDHIMIENINLSDTTLFIYNNIYWLFTTENIRNNKLTIFYSDNLFSKNWIKHPYSIKNTSWRCGGKIFIKNNKIYRPAQYCATVYGYSLIMYEIKKLTKTEYNEQIIDTIEPNWYPNIYGTHTMNFNNDYIVWDGKFKKV